MPMLIFFIFMALAAVMLVSKFRTPQRNPAAETIRRGVWRALKIVGLLLLIPALLYVAFIILIAATWHGC
jgi:lipopolysaccharide/colanic/teichoic acid biosynthesis glycosyltransferase